MELDLTTSLNITQKMSAGHVRAFLLAVPAEADLDFVVAQAYDDGPMGGSLARLQRIDAKWKQEAPMAPPGSPVPTR